MIDWLQSISAWASHVQGAGIPLSVADELTLETLAVRLRQSGTVIRDAETAAAWFGPVICRDADGQRQLMGILKAWEASLRVETPAPPSPIPQLDPVREELKVDSRWPRLWRLLMPILLLILSISMFSKDLWQGLGLQPPQPANPETPTKSWFQSYFPDSLLNAVFPTATGLVLAALFLFLIVKSWRSFRTATLLRGLAPRDVVSATVSLDVGDLSLFQFRSLTSVVADLRRPRLVESDRVDGTRSAAATVRAGGYPSFVQALRASTPAYLLLVDVRGADDIMRALGDLLFELLAKNEIDVERFEYQGDARRLRHMDKNGADLGVEQLTDLLARCPDHRVIVLTDCTNFFSSSGHGVRSWVNQLRAWPELAILTPLPTNQWGPRERLVSEHGFNLVSSTPEGLQQLSQSWRFGQWRGLAVNPQPWSSSLERRLASDPYRWTGDRTPSQQEVSELIQELRVCLGDSAMFYLQALAVFPILNPKLTLTLGRLLGDRRGQPLLTEENLAQLCRLPWLRNGRIPEWLRLALVIELRANPDRTEAVRAAWSTLLAPEKLVGEGLPVEVIRAVDPVLPLAVARLLPGYQPAERDAVLLAFLRKDALPVLAFELPSIPLQASPNLQPAAVPSAAILPRGFASLALAEFCERFAYYGMRITLILYMTSYSGLNVDERTASAAYAIFVTAAFVFGLPGGLIGDRLVGSSRAVFLGGGLIIAGSLVMSFGDSLSLLYIGMCIAVFGVGLFKPNIAAEVAQMFPEGGARSNAAFTIYYSSINVGAFLSSLIVGWIADRGGFRIAYLITSLCMTLGVVVFAVNHRTRLRASVGERGPAWGLTSWVRVGLLVVALGISLTLGQSDSTRSTFSSIILFGLAIAFYVSVFQPFSPDASGKSHTGYAPGRSRALTFLGLFMGAVVFWCGFEVSDSGVIQALYVIRDDMGLSASLLQLLPPIFTIALSIPFAIHWYRRATRESVPQATGAKFGSGLLVFGAGVLLMLYAVTNLHLGSSRIVPFILAQLFISSAEILIAPIGLTAVAKLAPPRFLATTFGIWALASSIGNLAAGFFSGNMGLEPGDVVRPMLVVAGMVMATGILLVAMRRKIP